MEGKKLRANNFPERVLGRNNCTCTLDNYFHTFLCFVYLSNTMFSLPTLQPLFDACSSFILFVIDNSNIMHSLSVPLIYKHLTIILLLEF